MAPRHQTLPPAQTSSAREALQSFHCSLCGKGYARMNEYEAHLSSYDHSHRQRLRDLKAMVRDPAAGARARRAEARVDGLVSITPLPELADGAPRKPATKKSGFRSAFAPAGAPAPAVAVVAEAASSDRESDAEDEGYEVYDPRYPTE